MKKELKYLAVTTLVTREEEYQGRKHLVVPVVALVEGVVQVLNAAAPEFVDADEFSKFPESWNGRPVFIDHPMVDGKPVSGNYPELLEAGSVGLIFNAAIKKDKLTMEAWIDVERAEKIAPELLERIARGDPIEISVGVFADTDDSTGVFEGKKYKGAWHNLVPDHLALLSKGHKGACSREMGCGVRAAAEPKALVIRKEGDEYCLYTRDGKKKLGCHDTEAGARKQEAAIKAEEGNVKKKDRTFGAVFAKMMEVFRTAQPATEMSSEDLRKKLGEEIRKIEPNYNYVEVYYPVQNPNRVVYSIYEPAPIGFGYSLYERQFDLSDSGLVTLGESRVEVEPVVSYEPVLMADEPVEVKDAIGRRNSAKDQAKIQAMHDHAIALGAHCTPKVAEGRPCGCNETKALSQEKDMNKEAIVKFLETATSEQLTALGETIEGTNPAVKAAQEAQAKAEADLKAAQDKAAADVKAATEKAAADVKTTKEDPGYVAFQAAQAEKKAATIKTLKDTGRCKLTDEVLAAKSQAELDQLVELAGAPKVATDFSGQGGPKDTSAPKAVAPAPSLADALKASREKK